MAKRKLEEEALDNLCAIVGDECCSGQDYLNEQKFGLARKALVRALAAIDKATEN